MNETAVNPEAGLPPTGRSGKAQNRSGLIGLLILALLASALAACRPESTISPEELQATSISATLTARPTATPPPSPTSELTASPLPPPTGTATHTVTPGPSPTPTPPPLPEGDPREGINLARPDYRDNFGSALTWVGPNAAHASNLWKEDHLEATDRLADHYIWWSTTIPEGGNVFAEVEAKIGDCTGKDAAGLGVRIDSTTLDSGYTVEVSCDGHYRVRKFSAGAVESLIDWTPAPGIEIGPDATNRIGLVAKGTLLAPVVNGQVVDEVQDYTYTYGNFALYANAMESPGVTVEFYDFALWFLQP